MILNDRAFASAPSLPAFLEDATLELTVLMPCLNEARNTRYAASGKRVPASTRLGLAAEVLVADNGSTDGSQQIAEDEGARVVPVPQRGYGAALRPRRHQARGRYIIMGDADDSYDFGNLARFVEKLRAGADLVMGNRFLGGIDPGAMPWKNKYLGNPVLSSSVGSFFVARRRLPLRPARVFERRVREWT